MAKLKFKMFEDGRVEWKLKGKFHREDGPAITTPNKSFFWYINGLCHRENGPAVEHANGNKFWYKK